ncbi:hypothetical protein AAHB60_20260 [Pseudomonas aeruginosa]
MADLLGRLCWRRTSPPWNDRAPVREELFGVERLEQHGESLAAAQPVTACPPIVRPLRRRLADNAAALLTAYRASASELERGRRVVPAAEWLLDNYHVVEEQIREIRDDLPPGYYRQLPKLASGPLLATRGSSGWHGLSSRIPTAISILSCCGVSSPPTSVSNR